MLSLAVKMINDFPKLIDIQEKGAKLAGWTLKRLAVPIYSIS